MADVSKINFSGTAYDLRDARGDNLLLSTLIIDTASYIGGTWTVTGGEESYSGSITGDTVEVGLRAHDTTYVITITTGTDDAFTASVKTGAYFEHYTVGADKFEPGAGLEALSWAAISEIAGQGKASAYWSVGDAKSVAVKGTVGMQEFDDETFYAYILGFDHNAELEGNNTIHWIFGKLDDGTDIAFCDDGYGVADSTAGYRMRLDAFNEGGWESSYMRQSICPQFLDALPSDLQAVIRDISKYADNVGNATGNVVTSITSTTDKIFLLAEYEIEGARTYANLYEQNYQMQYDYYASGNSKIKYRIGNTSTGIIWWTRSCRASANNTFVRVGADGETANNESDISRGFAPCFAV